jgi:hypothetical protein
MLRPQVFALQDGEVQIGLVCSEKQAIDATLASLAEEDPRFCPVADLYWNARGGSHTDGGSFIFSLESKNGKKVLSCHDKFGKPKTVPWFQKPWAGDAPEVDAERFEELAPRCGSCSRTRAARPCSILPPPACPNGPMPASWRSSRLPRSWPWKR